MNSEFQHLDEMEIGTTKSSNSHSRLVIEAYGGRGEILSVASDHSQGSVRLSQLETKERTENTDSSGEVSALDRLPYVARQAAANGESSVLIATGSGEMVGAFLPTFESEQLDAQVKGVEASGFKAQVRWFENGAGTGFVYELSASWDTEHHPELAKITAAALQGKAEALAAKKATLSPCDDLFAVDAAAALDENRLPDALELLHDCSVDAPNGFVVPFELQSFAESVAANEKKEKGLDMILKYGVANSKTVYFEGFELH